jgi:hypothetical protein
MITSDELKMYLENSMVKINKKWANLTLKL